MTSTRWFLTSLTYTAMIMAFYCKADRCPPPTALSYTWLDQLTVNLTWKRPSGLPNNTQVKYLVKKNALKPDLGTCVTNTFFTQSVLTEETDSDKLTYSIWTVSQCNDSRENTPANITIPLHKHRGEVVKDFRCSLYSGKMKCSWIPVNPSQKLGLSYRISCDCKKEITQTPIKKCSRLYSQGERTGCDIEAEVYDICILLETEAGRSTFKPLFVVPPPKQNITEVGDRLNVNLTPPEVGNNGCWKYKVCYQLCNQPEERCQDTRSGTSMIEVPYDKHCHYKFRSRVENDSHCPKLFSDFSEDVTYGADAPPDRTLTVVAIVIPIILSACVILSCYCLRRHSAIICPTIPDPSVIFKEMMMNGNKELKNTSSNLYTPVPEPIEHLRVAHVTENSDLSKTLHIEHTAVPEVKLDLHSGPTSRIFTD